MNKIKQIAAALTLAGTFGTNAYACSAAPSANEASLPVTMSINGNDKLSLSRGIWNIAIGKDNKFDVMSLMKCGQIKPDVYNAAEAQMKKLAADVCNPNVAVHATLEKGSEEVTQRHLDQFCKGVGNAQVVYMVPKIAP